MRCQKNYYGELPTLEVIQEGAILRVFFDFEDVSNQEEGESKSCICTNVDINGRTYEDIVSSIIRDKYSQDRVEAIMANHALKDDESIPEEKRTEYVNEYEAYQLYRLKAKQVANDVINTL